MILIDVLVANVMYSDLRKQKENIIENDIGCNSSSNISSNSSSKMK